MAARKSLSRNSKEPDPAMAVETRAKGGLAALLSHIDGLLVRGAAGLAMIGIFALVAAIAVVVGDIFWRRVGGGSFIGAVDLTQLSVMIAVSFAIPYAFATGGHVTVDLLSGALGYRAQRVLDVTALLLGAGIMSFLCWLSARRGIEVWTYGDVSQDLAMPMSLYWAALVSGLALSALICLVRAARLTTAPES